MITMVGVLLRLKQIDDATRYRDMICVHDNDRQQWQWQQHRKLKLPLAYWYGLVVVKRFAGRIVTTASSSSSSNAVDGDDDNDSYND